MLRTIIDCPIQDRHALDALTGDYLLGVGATSQCQISQYQLIEGDRYF